MADAGSGPPPPVSELADRRPPGERSLRAERIGRAVGDALQRWRQRPDEATVAPSGSPPVTRHPSAPRLPRPQRLRVEWRAYATPARRDQETFRAGWFRVSRRLIFWFDAALRFVLRVLWDVLRRRDSIERRAVHLRETLEEAGATFIKLGQQLAMRIDLIPYAYAHELERMLDSVPSFPSDEAVVLIEEAAGRPIREVFAELDPEPIASASIACVYQGLLHSGERVAIKVRRPGIGETFAADMRGLGWILGLFELFVLPPRFSQNLIFELGSMLMEELDFVREARYTELFRRRARKAKLATAPRVYFELSNRKVLVTEFVSGIFLTELLAAVEGKDQRALAALAAQRIDPARVARKLIRVNRFGGFEEILFHADLHPGNVLVQPGNKLVLIDFGSCGAFTERERVIWRRIMYAQSVEDVGAMVQAGLALLEPLPPIDVDNFSKKAEAVFWQDLYAIKSKHSEWWERTTASYWISFLKLAREYNIPMNLNTLRMIRVALLADTIALRLDPTIDHYQQYQKYLKGAGRRARKRLFKRLRGLFADSEFIQWEQIAQGATNAIYRAQRTIDSTYLQFSRLQSRAAFGLSIVLKGVFSVFVVTSAAVAGVVGWTRWVTQAPVDPVAVLRQQVLTNGWYQLFIAAAIFVAARRLIYRLQERQVS